MAANDEDKDYWRTAEFVSDMPKTFRTCRRNHHAFAPHMGHINDDKITKYEERKCTRCGVIRWEETTIRGALLSSGYKGYAEGYLTKGHGRLPDMGDAVRAVEFFENYGFEIPDTVLGRGRRRRR